MSANGSHSSFASPRRRPPETHGDFTTGDINLKIANRALPDETIDVAGTPVKTDVIESSQQVSGEYTGARTDTFWYSPELGLIIRYKIDSSLKGPTNRTSPPTRRSSRRHRKPDPAAGRVAAGDDPR